MNKIFSTRLRVLRHASRRRQRKKERKKKKKKKKKGKDRERDEHDTAICFFRQRGWLAFVLSIVECHRATDTRWPIVYTHHGSPGYNGNPITTARDLIRIIDFTGNRGATFLESESFYYRDRGTSFSSVRLESAVYHWLTRMHDERERLRITKEESRWILFPLFFFIRSLLSFFHAKRNCSIFSEIWVERFEEIIYLLELEKWWIHSSRGIIDRKFKRYLFRVIR